MKTKIPIVLVVVTLLSFVFVSMTLQNIYINNNEAFVTQSDKGKALKEPVKISNNTTVAQSAMHAVTVEGYTANVSMQVVDRYLSTIISDYKDVENAIEKQNAIATAKSAKYFLCTITGFVKSVAGAKQQQLLKQIERLEQPVQDLIASGDSNKQTVAFLQLQHSIDGITSLLPIHSNDVFHK